MRVVHAYKISKPEMEGGIPEVIDILASGLAARGLENEIVVARARGLGRIETYHGVKVSRSASLGDVLSLPISPTYPFLLKGRVKTADIVALHTPFPLADPVAAFLPPHQGLIVHWHADIVRQKRSAALLAPLRRAMLERADRIIVAHKSILESNDTLDAYREKIVIIPYGIDVKEWEQETLEDRAVIDRLRTEHPVLFVAIGRLVTYKGFDVLLEAMTRVRGHLIICGEGPERERLHAMIEAENLAAKVTLTGKVTPQEMRCYLKAATSFVFPSITAAETFGIVQLEAMAAGTAIINTALSTAVPDIARDQKEALTVTPGHVAELANAMQVMATNPSLRNRLAEAGRVRVQQEYSDASYVDKTLACYRDLYRTLNPQNQ